MLLEEKIEHINEKFKEIENEKNIVIWGAGRHTEELFKYTDLLKLNINCIVDKYNYGNTMFTYEVLRIKDIDWKNVDAVIISSHKYQEEISEELIVKYKFKRKIIKLYNKNDKNMFFKLQSNTKKNGFFNCDVVTWEEASKLSSGYYDENILKKCIESINKVVNGEAAYERDSFLFYKKEYSYHLIAFLFKAYIEDNKLNVLDFGGSLGSAFVQNKDILIDNIENIKWYVVEQEEFVKYGKKRLQDRNLRFAYNISDIDDKINCVVLSSCLQYLANYQEIIRDILKLKANYIIIDRTLVSEEEHICIQEVPENIYKAKYPVRIFNEDNLLNIFKESYQLVIDFHSYVDKDIYFEDYTAYSKAYVFKIRK